MYVNITICDYIYQWDWNSNIGNGENGRTVTVIYTYFRLQFLCSQCLIVPLCIESYSYSIKSKLTSDADFTSKCIYLSTCFLNATKIIFVSPFVLVSLEIWLRTNKFLNQRQFKLSTFNWYQSYSLSLKGFVNGKLIKFTSRYCLNSVSVIVFFYVK